MTGLEAMKAARARLSCERAYFAAALWTLRLIELPDMMEKYGVPGHFGVDKNWNLYFDPNEAARLLEKDICCLMAILVHELGHVVRRHSRRAELFDAKQLRWNLAADLEINDDLVRDELFVTDEDWLVPQKFNFPDGLTTEEYYELLQGHVIEVKVNCGSGAHGKAQPWEKASGPSAFEREATIKETAKRISQSRGTVPAGWKRWAQSEQEQQVDWRKELAAHLRNSVSFSRGLVDYTYCYPNRRQSVFGRIIMPSMLRPDPRPVFVIDTSGSMGEGELSSALTEAKGIFQALGYPTIHYVSVDATVAISRDAHSVQDIELVGGGGTDMRVGIEEALKHRPSVIVVFTDGYTPWPEADVGVPLICCIIHSEESGPDWAKTVRVT